MANLIYETCAHCAEQRAHFDIKALLCSWCRGTGFILKSYVCNVCGDAVRLDMYGELGLPDLKITGSYGSMYLNDCHTYFFALCERCLRNLFEHMEVPPEVRDVHDGDVLYKGDRETYVRMLWLRTGAEQRKLKLTQGLCTYTEFCRNEAHWRVFYSASVSDEALCDSHKSSVDHCENATVVPAEPLQHVPVDVKDQTEEQRWLVASEWLRAQPKQAWQYMPECLKPLTNAPDATSTWWFPSEKTWRSELTDAKELNIADGLLVWDLKIKAAWAELSKGNVNG
jgi:hypothetical protein